MISGVLARQVTRRPLWDNLLAPLTAAAAGGLTVTLVHRPAFDLDPPSFGRPRRGDLPAALVVAPAGALLALCAVRVLPYAHSAFRRLRHPMLMFPRRAVPCWAASRPWAAV